MIGLLLRSQRAGNRNGGSGPRAQPITRFSTTGSFSRAQDSYPTRPVPRVSAATELLSDERQTSWPTTACLRWYLGMSVAMRKVPVCGQV